MELAPDGDGYTYPDTRVPYKNIALPIIEIIKNKNYNELKELDTELGKLLENVVDVNDSTSHVEGTKFDTVSGATFTAQGILKATVDAVRKYEAEKNGNEVIQSIDVDLNGTENVYVITTSFMGQVTTNNKVLVGTEVDLSKLIAKVTYGDGSNKDVNYADLKKEGFTVKFKADDNGEEVDVPENNKVRLDLNTKSHYIYISKGDAKGELRIITIPRMYYERDLKYQAGDGDWTDIDLALENFINKGDIPNKLNPPAYKQNVAIKAADLDKTFKFKSTQYSDKEGGSSYLPAAQQEFNYDSVQFTEEEKAKLRQGEVVNKSINRRSGSLPNAITGVMYYGSSFSLDFSLAAQEDEEVNVDALKAKITEARAKMNEESTNAADKEKLRVAIESAEQLIGDEQKTQQAVNDKVAVLDTVIKSVGTAQVELNKTAINEKIAEGLRKKDEEGVTEAEKAKLDKVIREAQELLNTAKTQKELDDKVAELDKVIKGIGEIDTSVIIKKIFEGHRKIAEEGLKAADREKLEKLIREAEVLAGKAKTQKELDDKVAEIDACINSIVKLDVTAIKEKIAEGIEKKEKQISAADKAKLDKAITEAQELLNTANTQKELDDKAAQLKEVIDSINENQENPGSENENQENPGSENENQENPGSENGNQENPGSENENQGNTGSENENQGNTGSENENQGNTGSENENQGNTGSGNENSGNTGSENENQGNTGSENTNPSTDKDFGVQTSEDGSVSVNDEMKAFPKNTKLVVKEVPSELVKDILKNLVKENSVYVAYDISVLDAENNEVQPKDGSYVTLSIKVPSGLDLPTIRAYHITDDNKVEDVQGTLSQDGKTYMIKASKFSKYVLVGEKAKEKVDNNDDKKNEDNLPKTALGGGLTALLGMFGLSIVTLRKAKKMK